MDRTTSKRLDNIGSSIKKNSRTTYKKWKKAQHYYDYLHYRAQNEIRVQNLRLQEIESNRLDIDERLKGVNMNLAGVMLDEFYTSQKDAGYLESDIEMYFSEENLVNLSLDEYALLLKRFPGNMVTHVTRQGIRDHVGHGEHTAGLDSYHKGFMDIIDDGKLRSPMGICMMESNKKEAVANLLNLSNFENKKEALHAVNMHILGDRKAGYQGSYEDRNAIHFAREEVADEYYGSEKNNEIFFAYPTAHIASQYNFAGGLHLEGGSQHNDQWVWDKEQQGMDINAGITFIPKDTPVDPETGSRYQLDSNNYPVKNEVIIDSLKDFYESSKFDDFTVEVLDIMEKARKSSSQNALPVEHLDTPSLHKIYDRFENEFDISDMRLQNLVLNRLYEFGEQKGLQKRLEDLPNFRDGYSIDNFIEHIISDEGLLFKEAENTIPSSEFWKNYLKTNNISLSKIVFYESNDPTTALNKWKEENGIESREISETMGFDGKLIQRNDPLPTLVCKHNRLDCEQKTIARVFRSFVSSSAQI